MGFSQIVTGLTKSAMIITNCDSTFFSWKTFVSPWLYRAIGFEWLWAVIDPPWGEGCKGYLFKASRIGKDRDFTRWIIRKGREICHLGLPYGFIKLRKRSIFVIDSYLNGSAFTALKRDAKFLTKYVKGVTFVNRRYTKGVPFSWKMLYKRVRGWTSGRSLPA